MRGAARESKALAGALSQHAQAADAMNVGLLGRHFARADVHHDRIGLRPAIGDGVHLRDAKRVAHQVRRPQRIDALEEAGDAQRDRQDDVHARRDVVARDQLFDLRRR
jgi:hypothetical protein